MSIERLLGSASRLRDDADELGSILVEEGSVDCVYNPLKYAWDIHKRYIQIAGGRGAKTIMLGMNPGPHGMGQMGIPFAATSMVRDLLGISNISVEQPSTPHPKRPVIGLEYPREEVSGTRIWGLLSETYGDSDKIFINTELGITTIVNLHFLDLAKEFGDRLIGLRDGKLVFDGNVNDVSDEDFENIYGRSIKSSDLIGDD